MPIYVYECKKCKKIFEVLQSIKEPQYNFHYESQLDKLEEKICSGDINRIIQTVNVSVKKGTPKFFKK